MKKIALTLLILLQGSFVYADVAEKTASPATDASVVQNLNDIVIQTRPEIVGLWGIQVDDKKKCTEYYNFKSNREVVIQSDKEWSTGIYEYQPGLDMDLNLAGLIVQIQHDNNETDCSGIKEDQTGEVMQYYVKWKDQKSFELCNSENPSQCFSTLSKVLP